MQILNEEKIQMIFCKNILVYPSSPIHTMCEGVLYFQYVCGHDDLIKHKKGHFANKVKYIGTMYINQNSFYLNPISFPLK